MIDYKYEFNEWLESEHNKQNNRKTYRKKFIGSRGYPHFDSTVSLDNAEQIGKLQQFTYSPKSLVQWKFLPFIRKDQRNRKFKHNPVKLRPIAYKDQKQYTHIKSRPIMYASHYDACVFSFIGFILARYYEKELEERNLTSNVIAYRSIKGFNNISFAKQAFDFMEKSNDFACLLIDIKGFFDNIQHATLIEAIETILADEIDPVIKYVMKNLTNYRYVIEDEVIKEIKKNKKSYFVPIGKNAARLCKIEDFNKLINNNKFIRKNTKGYGFPQGSPISGLLANIFLMDFDTWLCDKLSDFNVNFYQRYSDDMLIICPIDQVEGLYKEIKQRLKSFGLSLSTNKTELFTKDGDNLKNNLNLLDSSKSRKRENIQYLGLEWNGKQIILRPSTIGRRLRPKNKLAKKYWNYHIYAINKIDQKSIKKQYSRIRKTIKEK